MPDTSPVPDEQRLVDIDYLAELTRLSKPTLWRHHESGKLPRGCKIGRSVRWRLRTGNQSTGILDWLEAGCMPINSELPSSRMEG